MEKLKLFIKKCKRVWIVLKKPTKKEFEQISKISGIGILVLGLIGFIVTLIMEIFV
jgi:protein transport protein SEC61 subunit gamma-like protein